MSIEAYLHAYTEGAPDAPLVFTFHGTGGTEMQFHNLARSLMPEASIVSPRGDVSEMGAARFFRRAAEGVYDMDDLAFRTGKMAGFIEAWRARLPNRPVFAFGYSNGANILASVLMEKPGIFDRVGLLHPLIPWQPEPVEGLTGTRVLVSAGRNDPICPWPMTETLTAWFGDQGAVVSTEVHSGGHEILANEVEALRNLFAD